MQTISTMADLMQSQTSMGIIGADVHTCPNCSRPMSWDGGGYYCRKCHAVVVERTKDRPEVSPDQSPKGGAKSQRIKKAERLGYNNIVTHNGYEKDVTVRKRSGAFEKFDGIFASYGEESKYGNGAHETTFVLKEEAVAELGDTDLDYSKSMSFLKKEYPNLLPDQLARLYDLTADDENIWDEEDNNPLAEYGFSDIAEASWEYQNIRGKIAADQGFDAVEVDDEFGTSVFIPFGSNAKKLSSSIFDNVDKHISSLPGVSDSEAKRQRRGKEKAIQAHNKLHPYGVCSCEMCAR